MTMTRMRPVLGASVAALLLSLSACGDDSGGSDDSTGEPAGSVEEAYAAYAQAVRDDDVDAFRGVITKGFFTDLSPERSDTADYVHDLHWALEQDLLALPEDPDKILQADDMGLVDEQISALGDAAGIDGLEADDVAAVVIEDSHLSVREACYDDPEAEDCAPAEDAEPSDILIAVLRDGDTWRVAGTEPTQ